MSHKETVDKDARLRILQLLAKDLGGPQNIHVIMTGLDTLGHRVSHKALRAHLSWLAENDLVKVGGDEVLVAQIRLSGIDIAEGRVSHAGIAAAAPD